MGCAKLSALLNSDRQENSIIERKRLREERKGSGGIAESVCIYFSFFSFNLKVCLWSETQSRGWIRFSIKAKVSIVWPILHERKWKWTEMPITLTQDQIFLIFLFFFDKRPSFSHIKIYKIQLYIYILRESLQIPLRCEKESEDIEQE